MLGKNSGVIAIIMKDDNYQNFCLFIVLSIVNI